MTDDSSFVPPQTHSAAATATSAIPDPLRVYAVFQSLISLALERLGGELGGRLLLYRDLDARGAAVALAANIAGAATLGVDADGERLRRGMRHGTCDFVVNTLDEALRILKNEVRKKQPVSVCLEADPVAALREAVERGLQPDLVDGFGEGDAGLNALIERGAIVLHEGGDPGPSRNEVSWMAASAPARWLPRVDALAAESLPIGDPRSRWLKLAPRYLGRSLADRRYVRMTDTEAERFSGLVAAAVAAGAIGVEITIDCRRPSLR